MRTAVTYSRVSTGRQAEKGQSLPQQTESLKLYCQLKEWRVLRHFIEPAKSARKMDNRPELAEALDLVCERQGVLVVWKLDRLIRSAADCERICERLTDSGADLASVTESVDTSTAMGKAFLGITSVFARLESDKIGERVKASNGHAVEKLGYRTQGVQPAGYTIVDGRRVVVEDELDLVRKIQAYSATGMSHQAIACELNCCGFRTIGQIRKYKRVPKHGWQANVIKKILREAAE